MKKQENWKTSLRTDPTDWLLEQAEALDRYYILREILGKPEEDEEVTSLRTTLRDEILGKQAEDGSWSDKVYDYSQGTTHQLMKLMELGLNARDMPIKKGVEYLLQFQAQDGSFVQERPGCGVEANLVVTNAVILALVRTGYGEDPRVTRASEWLCRWQQDDGSWLSPRAEKSTEESGEYPDPYCGIHATCNVLLGLSALEMTRRSEAAERGAKYLLSLYGHKYDMSGATEPPYFKSIWGKKRMPFEGAWFDPRCIPPHAGAVSDREIEILSTEEVLSSLSMLRYGLENEKVKGGLERLVEFQTDDGRWLFPNSEMSHGFTLDALMTIKSLHQPLCVFTFHGH